MTAVGKILVFLNLIFSVATAGLIVMVFTTRASWKAEYEKVKNVAVVAEAAYKSEKTARENDVKSRDSQIKSQADTIAALTSERDGYRKQFDDSRAQIAKAREEITAAVSNHQALSNEVTSLKVERDTLAGDVNTLRGKVLATQKELNDQKLLAVNNRIEADSFKAKSDRLLTRLEEVEKNLTVANNRLNALGATGGTGREPSLLTPPPTPAPRDVKATVTAVATSGLTVINIGSDSGLSAGNKLDVYRVDPNEPLKSIYLGELVISRTEPKQAVGQFYPKPFAKPDERLPKVKDIVSTTLGSR